MKPLLFILWLLGLACFGNLFPGEYALQDGVGAVWFVVSAIILFWSMAQKNLE